MVWSQNETKLAYLAEKKVPKSKSFYESAAAPKPKDTKDEGGKKAEVEFVSIYKVEECPLHTFEF